MEVMDKKDRSFIPRPKSREISLDQTQAPGVHGMNEMRMVNWWIRTGSPGMLEWEAAAFLQSSQATRKS